MKLNTKALIALALGGVLVGLALFYGVSGSMLSSISKRSDNIERWEAQLVKDTQELTTYIAKVEELGKKQNATPDEREQYEHQVGRVERMTESLRLDVDRIADERSHRKQQLITTVVLAILGVLAMLVGVRLLRRAS